MFLGSIEGTDFITNTDFCLDNVNTTSTTIQDVEEVTTRNIVSVSSHTPIQTCTNKISEKVGIMSFEDYVYANNGNSPVYTGGSFLDEDELAWTITPYDDNRIWIEWFKNPASITAQVDSSGYSKIDILGHGVRPIVSIGDTAIKSGTGTKRNPYILVGEKAASKGSNIDHVKVGEYVYLDESNNPYSFTEETIINGVTYKTTKDKVRYRVVKKNNDGSVKVERADVLRNLSLTISINYGNTEEYIYQKSINIGDYLNSSSNSFYSWYSDTTKSMIKKETYHRYTSGYGNYAGSYRTAIRPIVTLKLNVKIRGRKGTMTEPYTLYL